MFTVVVVHDATFDVHLFAGHGGAVQSVAPATEAEPGEEEPDEGPSPIAPELKELAWGGGAFIVFLIVMRLFLFPRVKQGMEARYGKIEGDHTAAKETKAAAQQDVEQYEQALAEVRAEVATKIDAARQTLEAERTEKLQQVTARIAERRAAAADQLAEAKEANRPSVEQAVVGLVADVSEMATGRRPDDTAVQRAVGEAMGAGARQ